MLQRCIRDWKRTLLVAILICLTCSLMGVGIIVLEFSEYLTQQADDTLTTIAVRTHAASDLIVADTAITEFLEDSPYVLRYQIGSAAVAIASNLTPVYSLDRVDATYQGAEVEGWNNAVLLATVTEVVQASPDSAWQAKATVDQVLAYAIPSHVENTVEITCEVLFLTEDGEIPLERGKQYVIYGKYSPPGYLVFPGDDVYTQIEGTSAKLWLGGFFDVQQHARGTRPGQKYTLEEIIALSERIGYTFHDEWPYVSIEADQQYLNQLVEMIEWNNKRLLVFALDEPEQMLYFHQKEAFVTAGRLFSPKEKTEGAPVCLISSALADKNGLSVGDTIPCQLYTCSFDNMNSIYGHFSLEPSLAATSLGEAEYTIVGMYSTPSWDQGAYAIDPNTIIVPHSAVSASLEHTPYNLQTIILVNGGAQAFQAELDEAGFPNGSFSIYDQGYDTLVPVLASMLQDAWTFLIGCLVVGYVLTVIVLLLYGRAWGMENRILNVLGMPMNKIFLRMAGCFTAITSVGIFISIPVAYAAHSTVLKTMQQLYLSGDIPAILSEMAFSVVLPRLCCNALVMLMAGVGVSYLLARRKKLKW